tara:strand:- start:700 stop:942 length:243 start_codon:yes stop_codon:yes gene_type:complete
MPTYVFKDKETGEISEIVLRMSELDQYKEDNPNLETQVQASKFVGTQTDMLTKAGDGWKEVQQRIKAGMPPRHRDRITTK